MTSRTGSHLRAIVGDNIARAKAEKSVTDRDVAFAIDADSGQVAKWRRGEHMPSETYLAAMAHYFGVELSWFYIDRRAEAVPA